MFYNSRWRRIIRKALFAALFVFGITAIFPQSDDYIPEELLRPRREEAPRYPIDTVIGTLGQGKASPEAYAFARRIAGALLAGDIESSVLSAISRPLLEESLDKLQEINPRYFRLGSGQEEPDGAVSFLLRFAGREQGITGELFIRFAELRRPSATPPPVEESSEEPADLESADLQSVDLQSVDLQSGDIETADLQSVDLQPADIKNTVPPDVKPAGRRFANRRSADVETKAIESEALEVPTVDPEAVADDSAEEIASEIMPEPVPPPTPAERVWVFEDLILESPRSREIENAESRHQFDFPPYERFF